jgi:hypothetical protein
MDQNLSGLIAANVTLMQPSYIPLINASAGVIGGFVTGMITLADVTFFMLIFHLPRISRSYLDL